MEYKGMMKILFVSLLVLTLPMTSCATPDIRKCPDTEAGPNFVPGQLLIVFKKGTESSRIHEINETVNGKELKEMLRGSITLVEGPDGSSIEEFCQAYLAFSEVEAVNLNYSGIRPLEENP